MGDALLTDRYELTMLEAAVRDGTAGRTAVFQTFCRSLPPGRRYGMVAGLGRLLPLVVGLRFSEQERDWLLEAGVVGEATAEWLADYRFGGDVVAYPEGEVFLPGSPVLQVVGSFAETVVLETLVLSILNHDSAIAAAAARMVSAAGGRSLLEFGSRRTHERAAVDAARAAWVAGFDGTSNLEAGRLHGVPTLGTAAHAWTLLHDDEEAAFATQVATNGPGTTLLVDTYDVPEGIRRAVAVAGTDLGGIRIDSGDLAEAAHAARAQLDELGAPKARIVVSGDLDEHAIAALADAPVDGYGVGTQLVVGSGHPTANLVYKLVARSGEPGGAPDLPVAKSSEDKATTPGRLRATRVLDLTGTARAEVLTPWDDTPPAGRPVQVEVVRGGELVLDEPTAAARDRAQRSVAELPPGATDLTDGTPALPTEHRGTRERGSTGS